LIGGTSSAPQGKASGSSSAVQNALAIPATQHGLPNEGKVSDSVGLVGTPALVDIPDVTIDVRWGPANQMPGFPYGPLYRGGAAYSNSRDSCQQAVDNIWQATFTVIGAGLLACGKAAIAIALGCGPFWWACGLAGVAICSAAAAGAAVLSDAARRQATRACSIRVDCTDPRANCPPPVN
jgi:hypothetical protein